MIQKKLCFQPLKRQKTSRSNDEEKIVAESNVVHVQDLKHHDGHNAKNPTEVIEILSSSDEDDDYNGNGNNNGNGNKKIDHLIPQDCSSKGGWTHHDEHPHENKGDKILTEAQPTTSKQSSDFPSSSSSSAAAAAAASPDQQSQTQNHRNTKSNHVRLLSYARSAYVQNLAEICHDILYDGEYYKH